MLQRLSPSRSAGEAFVAGLLHDIGRLVVARYLPEDFLKVQALVEQGEQGIWQIEHEVLGMGHAEIGGLLCRHWNLPEVLGEAITWHHAPLFQEVRDPLTCILHVAEYMALRSSRHPHMEGRLRPIEDGVADVLGLRRNARGEPDLVWYLERFQAELERAEAFRDLMLGRQVQESAP
jgi:HD-like signal output (HDOD) protein